MLRTGDAQAGGRVTHQHLLSAAQDSAAQTAPQKNYFGGYVISVPRQYCGNITLVMGDFGLASEECTQ